MCSEYQEMELLKDLTDYFHFDHHFFLLGSTADANRFVNRNGTIPQTVYVSRSVNTEIGFEDVGEINSKNAFTIVVPDTSELDQNLYLLNGLKAIQRQQINMKIGVFFSQDISNEDLEEFFEWCKDHIIINILAVLYPDYAVDQRYCPEASLNIFIFNPFGALNVINVTSAETFDDLFLSEKSNFNQHELRCSYSNYYRSDQKLWLTVFDLMNASFNMAEYNYTSTDEALEDGVDVIIELLLPVPGHLRVYSVESVRHIIIVPESLPYSEFSAYVRNAISGEIFYYSYFTIIAVIVVLSIIRSVKQKKIIFWQCVCDVLNLIMNDNGHIKYQQLYRMEIILIVPLTFVGLIVTNGILSELQSHLTRPLLQPQIDSIEDMHKSGFPVFAFLPTWKDIAVSELSSRTKYTDWDEKVVVIDEGFHKFIDTYSGTMSALVDSEFGNLLLRIQKRLDIKGYHNPHIEISRHLYTYHVNTKFFFIERLNEIIHRIKSAGLYELWLQQELNFIETKILAENVDRLKNQKVAYVKNFEFPMFIVYGWLAGFVVLIFEIVWKKTPKIRMLKKLSKLSSLIIKLKVRLNFSKRSK